MQLILIIILSGLLTILLFGLLLFGVIFSAINKHSGKGLPVLRFVKGEKHDKKRQEVIFREQQVVSSGGFIVGSGSDKKIGELLLAADKKQEKKQQGRAKNLARVYKPTEQRLPVEKVENNKKIKTQEEKAKQQKQSAKIEKQSAKTAKTVAVYKDVETIKVANLVSGDNTKNSKYKKTIKRTMMLTVAEDSVACGATLKKTSPDPHKQVPTIRIDQLFTGDKEVSSDTISIKEIEKQGRLATASVKIKTKKDAS